MSLITFSFNHHLFTCVSVLALVCLHNTPVHAADELYRYIGNKGEVVIDDRIPPEFVPKGYSILNKNGMVIETIEPALTDEDRANMSHEQQREELRKEQKRKDRWLLERYSDAGDAVRARDRNLSALNTLIIVAESNIRKLKQDEEKELAYAAAAEREGKEVPAVVLDALENIRAQIRSAEQHILVQKEEQKKITQTFAKHIERLEEIEKEKKEGEVKLPLGWQ